jgi:hypothetical protein
MKPHMCYVDPVGHLSAETLLTAAAPGKLTHVQDLLSDTIMRHNVFGWGV